MKHIAEEDRAKNEGDPRPLVVHVLHRFDVGGLENGVANLIDRLTGFRHAILALTEITDFKRRIRRDDVGYYALSKRPGHLYRYYPWLYRFFRSLSPVIVHSRNLAALEVVVPAWLAGVPIRIHGEHGRDIGDLAGDNHLYRWLRRLYDPFVTHWITLSQDLEHYLSRRVRIATAKISRICNGVDAQRFHPRPQPFAVPAGCPFIPGRHWLVGTVGRMQAVKNQTLLARAFVRVLQKAPTLRDRLRLVMIGDGPLRRECISILESAGLAEIAWLPGKREDIPAILQTLDCFVLPSLAEGISNTILEAMASGVPVIATDVGGNGELVVEGVTGRLVPREDVEAMAAAILGFAEQPGFAQKMGAAARAAVERDFSLEVMAFRYADLYHRLLQAQEH